MLPLNDARDGAEMSGGGAGRQGCGVDPAEVADEDGYGVEHGWEPNSQHSHSINHSPLINFQRGRRGSDVW